MANTTINGIKLYRSTLRTSLKRPFNPKKPEDILEYKHFLKHDGWKTVCPFELEWPYTSVPHMIADKIATYYVTKIFKAT
jgi:hypothetical protein